MKKYLTARIDEKTESAVIEEAKRRGIKKCKMARIVLEKWAERYHEKGAGGACKSAPTRIT